MNIQRASEVSGLPASTIRYYERRGVLPAPPRLDNGYRAYTDEHVRRLRLIRSLRELGVSLAAIGRIGAVAHDGSCGELREQLLDTVGATIDEVTRRQRELRRARRELAEIDAGLRRMAEPVGDVPGLTACDCVKLVAGA